MENLPARCVSVCPVRDGWRCVAVAVTLVLHSSPAAGQDSPSALLKKLADPRFEVRTQAERDLGKIKAVDLPALADAARREPEQAARIVALLERLYIGAPAETSSSTPGRAAVLSTLDAMMAIRRVGDYGETETTQAAESALDELAAGDSAAAALAQAALARHVVLAENRAIAALRRLGAKVVFSANPDPMHEALGELADGAATGKVETPATEPPPSLSVLHVYILRRWTGGIEGLQHLRKLRVDGGLQLYLVDGCGVSMQDALAFKAHIPGLTPIERSAATLGVRWVGYQLSDDGGCEIAGITDGLAADKAGLQNNFIIRKVNGDPIRTFDDGTPQSLVQRLRSCMPGETVTLAVQKTPTGPLEDVRVTLSDWSEGPDVQVVGYR
jgi:hypothetical protein